MLGMVNFHSLSIDMRFEGIIGVGQLGQFIRIVANSWRLFGKVKRVFL